MQGEKLTLKTSSHIYGTLDWTRWVGMEIGRKAFCHQNVEKELVLLSTAQLSDSKIPHTKHTCGLDMDPFAIEIHQRSTRRRNVWDSRDTTHNCGWDRRRGGGGARRGEAMWGGRGEWERERC